ncbi:hypothetical protein SynSYN20_03177 [Synechococcus sp. SYN20]|nr:hypothetical protein SynSYN20_03177 [Synechococcus sp. SYN20]
MLLLCLFCWHLLLADSFVVFVVDLSTRFSAPFDSLIYIIFE